MSDAHRDTATNEQLDSAAVTAVLRDMRDPVPDETDDGPERFTLADPEEPVAYVFELPAEGQLEHVDTVPIDAAEAVDCDESDHRG